MVDGETTGIPYEQTGVATSDDKEITRVSDTEADGMADIDSTIAEVAATLDQELREENV